ncbi:MAG: ABC transporter ATP-binding protein [Lachnospiraceae bacterium]|nr:ABC transporter ATP-binding protein [Lachnospiraceae bacterium]MCR5459421.1 ABC transporter ATP-binding protein [Acetatifactor sp.]
MIKLVDATKKYNSQSNEILALNHTSMTIQAGEMVAVMGTSGCGKSTLLNILGGMDRLTSGHYYFEDEDIASFGPHKLHLFRKNHIGFVFQNFALLNRQTVYENLEIPLLARNQRHYKKRIMDCLEQLGLAERAKSLPLNLSGGQQQRCAIGRALMTGCSLLLCDEPTGALDSKTTKEIMDLFCKLNMEGKTIIIATHDDEVAKCCKRIVRMEDGVLQQ